MGVVAIERVPTCRLMVIERFSMLWVRVIERFSPKPKIKSAYDLSTPIFTTNDKGALIMNTNLSLVAEALNIAERLA